MAAQARGLTEIAATSVAAWDPWNGSGLVADGTLSDFTGQR